MQERNDEINLIDVFSSIRNKDLCIRDEERFLDYVKKHFIELFIYAYRENDNDTIFSFFKEHNMTQDKSLFVNNIRAMSLYLEILILRDDLKALDYLLTHYKHDLFTDRAFLFAIRYKNKEFLEILVKAKLSFNLEALYKSNLPLDHAMPFIHSMFYAKNRDFKEYQKIANLFNCDCSFNHSNVLLMLISNNINLTFNAFNIKFYDYRQDRDNELEHQRANTQDELLDNIKFLVESNAISDDLISHLYFYSIFYDYKNFKEYFASINSKFLNQDLQTLLYCISENLLGLLLENTDDKVKDNFLDNLNFFIEKAKEQDVKLYLYYQFSDFILKYENYNVISYCGVNLNYKNIIKTLFDEDYLLDLCSYCDFVVEDNEISSFYTNLILARKFNLTNYLLESKKVAFKSREDEILFFKSLQDLCHKDDLNDILPFVINKLFALQNVSKQDFLYL